MPHSPIIRPKLSRSHFMRQDATRNLGWLRCPAGDDEGHGEPIPAVLKEQDQGDAAATPETAHTTRSARAKSCGLLPSC